MSNANDLQVLAADGIGTVNLVKQAHNIANATTVDIPTCQNGDVGIFIVSGSGGTSNPVPTAISAPSGWTEIGTAGGVAGSSGDRMRIQAFRRVLASTDGGTTLTGIDGAVSETNAVIVFRGDSGVQVIGDGGFGGEVTSGNPAPVVVSATSATRKSVVVFGVHLSRAGDTKSITFSPTTFDDSIVDGDDRLKICWNVFPDDEPEDTTVDTGDSGSGNAFCAFYIEAE